MVALDEHPLADRLEAWALGRCPTADADRISAHLADCPACLDYTAEFGGDGFTALLREADAGPSTTTDELPAALRDHPRYRFGERRGGGGMGSVWKAEHRELGRTVAVKVIRPEFLADPRAVERFRREVLAAGKLHHPHIVTAFDAEQVGDHQLLAMEFVDGQSLDEYLAERGQLPVHEACDLARQAALGLQHAHEHGLVHRDVKPHNLMRTTTGQVKLLDFGMARLVHAEAGEKARLTGANVVLGTVDYIAPEQAANAQAADIRADLYSLGCTLYELLAGQPPHPRGSVIERLMAHALHDAPPLRSVRPDVPAALDAVINRLLAKRPAERFASPADAAAALAPFCEPGGRAYRTPRRPWVAVAASFAALVVALGVVVRVQTDRGELVIESDSGDVEVVVSKAGREVAVIDTRTQKRLTLPTGDYGLAVPGQDGLTLDIDRATLKRGEQVLARVRREAKPADHDQGTETFVATKTDPPDVELQRIDARLAEYRDARATHNLASAAANIRDAHQGRETLVGMVGRARPVERDGKRIALAIRPDTSAREIQNVGVSASGRYAFAATTSRCKLFDAATGAELADVPGYQAAFLGDGERVAVFHGSIRIHETRTGKLLRTSGELYDEAFWPTVDAAGGLLAFRTAKFAAVHYDLAAMKELSTWELAAGWVRPEMPPFSFAADGSLVSNGPPGYPNVATRSWPRAGGSQGRLEGTEPGDVALAVAADATVVRRKSRLVRLDAKTGKPLADLGGLVPTGELLTLNTTVATPAAFTADGKRAAFIEDGQSVVRVDLVGNARLDVRSLLGLGKARRDPWHTLLGLDAAGRTAVVASDDTLYVVRFDAATPAVERYPYPPPTSAGGSSAATPADAFALLRTVPADFGSRRTVNRVQISPDGTRALLAGVWTGGERQESQRVRVYDLDTGAKLFDQPGAWAALVDGGAKLVAFADKAIWLLDVATGKVLVERPWVGDQVLRIDVLPSGKFLTVCDYKKTCVLLDAATLQERHRWLYAAAGRKTLHVAPTANLVLIRQGVGGSTAWEWWDAAANRARPAPALQPTEEVAYLLPDGDRAAVWAEGGCRVAHLRTGERGPRIAELPAEPGTRRAVSPTGSCVVAALADGTAVLRRWEAGTDLARLSVRLAGPDWLTAPDAEVGSAFTPDHRRLVVPTSAGMYVLQLPPLPDYPATPTTRPAVEPITRDGRRVGVWLTLPEFAGRAVMHAGVSRDGKYAFATHGMRCLLVEVATGTTLAEVPGYDAAFVGDGERVVVCGDVLQLVETRTGKVIARGVEHYPELADLAIDPTGTHVVARNAADADGPYYAVDLATFRETRRDLRPDGRPVFAGDGRLAVRERGRNTVRLIDLAATGGEAALTVQSAAAVLALPRAGRRALVRQRDVLLTVDTATGDTLYDHGDIAPRHRTLGPGDTRPLLHAYAPAGDRVLTRESRASTFTLRDLFGRAASQTFTLPRELAAGDLAFGFSGDGRHGYARAADGVAVFDLGPPPADTLPAREPITVEGRHVGTLLGHAVPAGADRPAITAAGVSADGRFAFAATADGRCRLLDAATGAVLHDLPGRTAAFVGDGERVAVVGDRLRLIETRTGRQLAEGEERFAAGDAIDVTVAGGRLVVEQYDGKGVAVIAYDAATLRAARRWDHPKRDGAYSVLPLVTGDKLLLITPATPAVTSSFAPRVNDVAAVMAWDVAADKRVADLPGLSGVGVDDLRWVAADLSAALVRRGDRLLTLDPRTGATVAVHGRAADLLGADDSWRARSRITADGRRALARRDGTAWALVEVATGRELWRYAGPRGLLDRPGGRTVGFTADGRTGVAATLDGLMLLHFDAPPAAATPAPPPADAFALLRTIPADKPWRPTVKRVQVSADGTRALVAGLQVGGRDIQDGVVVVYDLATGATLFHRPGGWAALVDGGASVVVFSDRTVSRHEIGTDRGTVRPWTGGEPTRLDVTASGRYVVVCERTRCALLDAATLQTRHEWPVSATGRDCLQLSPVADVVYLHTGDGWQAWDAAANRPLPTVGLEPRDRLAYLLSDGERAAIVNGDGFRVKHLVTGDLGPRIADWVEDKQTVWTALSPTGSCAVVRDAAGNVALRRWEKDAALARLPAGVVGGQPVTIQEAGGDYSRDHRRLVHLTTAGLHVLQLPPLPDDPAKSAEPPPPPAPAFAPVPILKGDQIYAHRFPLGWGNDLYGIAVSPDGSRLFAGSKGLRGVLLNTATGAVKWERPGYAAAFLGDGSTIAVLGDRVRVYDTATGTLLREGQQPLMKVGRFEANRAGTHLLVDDGTANGPHTLLIDLTTMATARDWRGRAAYGTYRFTADGGHVALTTQDTLRWHLYRVADGVTRPGYRGLGLADLPLAFLPGEVIAKTSSGAVVVRDATTGEVRKRYPASLTEPALVEVGKREPVEPFASPDGRWLLTAVGDRNTAELRLHRGENGAVVERLTAAQAGGPLRAGSWSNPTVAWSAAGRAVAVATAAGDVVLMPLPGESPPTTTLAIGGSSPLPMPAEERATLHLVRRVERPSPTWGGNSPFVSPDGRWAAAAFDAAKRADERVPSYLVAAADEREVAMTAAGTPHGFVDGGDSLLVFDTALRTLPLAKGRESRAAGDALKAWRVRALSPDGTRIALGANANDGERFALLDAATLADLKPLEGTIPKDRKAPVARPTLSGDGRWFVAPQQVSDHRTPYWKVWDATTTRPVEPPRSAVVGNLAAVWPDRNLSLIPGSGNRWLYYHFAGSPVMNCPAPAAPAARTPDGRFSATADGEAVRLYAYASNERLAEFRLPADDGAIPETPATRFTPAAAISPDGRFVAAVTGKALWLFRVEHLPPLPPLQVEP